MALRLFLLAGGRWRTGCGCGRLAGGFFRRRRHRRAGNLGRGTLVLWRGSNRGVLAHFSSFWADTADCLQVVHTLESAVVFSRLDNFFGRCPTNSGNQLKFVGTGGIEVDGVRWRFLLRTKSPRHPEHRDRSKFPRHSHRKRSQISKPG
jgi:hypothetical protein